MMSILPTRSVFPALVSLACRVPALVTVCLLLAIGFATPARAQDLPIYTDSLQNGFQDWSWAPDNLSNTSPVQSGNASIAVTATAGYQAFSLHSGNINMTNYSALSFWVNGGPTGGQQFVVHMLGANEPNLPSVPVTNYIAGGVIPANAWVHVTIPLTDLQAAALTDFNRFWFADTTGSPQPVYYVDTITLVGQPTPSLVHVTVNAAQTLQTVDSREFGVNTAIWDGNLGSSTTAGLMNAAGATVFRFPGGSASDAYDWTVQQYNGQTTIPTLGSLTDATGAQAFITINYGTGSAQMAAAWVAYCNAAPTSTVVIGRDPSGRDWHTAGYWAALRGASHLSSDDGLNFLRVSHAAPYGYKNWEIGNECYGSWETDTHTAAQDPVIYANFTKTASALMKQVDPTIKIGVVVQASEDSDGNQTETVTNPVTGVSHRGWSAVLYSTLNGLNYIPDFVIYHNYAQSPGGENDSVLLQYSSTWTGDATAIRTMLTQYLGAARSAGSQIIATENNSVYGNPGKQSTSLVNGLFYADSFGAIMQTEFKGLVWWDLRNGGDTSQNNSSSLYGWRLYGDYGILGSAGVLPGGNQDTPYPTYFALKLVSKFARGGDVIVPATSDYTGLSAYACKRANGNLCLLIVNKNSTTDLPANITLTGYTPTASAIVYQYGKVQDGAQAGGAAVDLAQTTLGGVNTTFSTTFPSYSMTVITLTPNARTLLTWGAKDVAAGADGTARILWTRSDGAAGLWVMNAHDTQSTIGATYGPFPGWSAKAVSVAGDGTGRLLWTNTNGQAGVWKMSPTGTEMTIGPNLGPFTGWTATDIAAASDGTSRVLWTNTNGEAGVWTLNAAGANTQIGPTYGPFAGWSAKSVGVAGDGTARVLWTNTSGQAGVWTLNASDVETAIGPTYGPYSDSHGAWHATDSGTSSDGTSQVLWTRSDGAVGVWTFSAADTQTAVGPVYGPSAGYTASAFDASSDQGRILWIGSTRTAGLWSFGANDTESVIGSVYGPF